MFWVKPSCLQTMAMSILPPPIVKCSYRQDLSAPKKSSFGFLTSAAVMQCLLVSLRRSAKLCFILSAYCAGMPGMFISRTVTFDCQSPGSTIESLVMTPDCFTAAATSFPVAFLTFTVGPLLHATRHNADATAHTAYFMAGP